MRLGRADIFVLAKLGDLDTFKKKFDPNDMNKKDDFGCGLLHSSIANSKFDIALFLINSGIDVNLISSDGNTALHVICENPNIEVAKALLERGADINIRDKYGNNAMWTAAFNCKGRYYEMVKLFMSYNSDRLTKNDIMKLNQIYSCKRQIVATMSFRKGCESVGSIKVDRNIEQ